jgi:hypothetical protein
MPHVNRLLPLALIFVTLAGCNNPRSDALIFQQLNDAADQFAVLRNEVGILHDRVDSLNLVTAKQDSLIRILANIAGYPIGR